MRTTPVLLSILLLAALAPSAGAVHAVQQDGGAQLIVALAEVAAEPDLLALPSRLEVRQIPLERALVELQERSGVSLAYSPTIVAGHGDVSCACATATVEQAIGELLRGTGLQYEVLARRLVVREAPPPTRTVPASLASSAPVLFNLARAAGAPALRSTLRARTFQGTVTGVVTDARSGAPITSVQVYIQGTGLGALTQPNGRYLLLTVPVGTHTVIAERLGYGTVTRSVTVTEGGTTELNIEMDEQALGLDEIVVTGTAGRQMRRTQPAQVDVIRASDVVEVAPIASVRDLLQSRSPGVSVLGNGGSPGGGQRIRIRGPVSVDLSSQPLVFVDGVRINARLETSSRMEAGGGSGSPSNTGGSVTSRLNDIAPEDIESIEIVKGPAAATLYGADASAGVINIITKRGRQGGFQQTVNVEYDVVEATWTPPDNYARCTQAAIDQDALICQGRSAGDLVQDNPLLRENVIRNGHLERLTWSGQGGSSDHRYYASLARNKETGMLPGESDERWNGRFNFSWQPQPYISLTAGFGLTYGHNKQIDNGNSLYGLFVNAFLGDPLTLGGTNDGWLALRRPEHIGEIDNVVDVIRNMPTLEIAFDPFEWFGHRLILGGDFSNSETRKTMPRNDLGLFGALDNRGWNKETRRSVRNLTLDYMTTLRQRFGGEQQFSTSLALGTQVVAERTDLLFGDGFGFVTNAARALSATAERSGGQWFAEERSVGYMSQLELGHRDRLFVQVGVRADQNSSFGEDVPTIWLPKVGVSFVASDTDFVRSIAPWMSTLRLRAAYGTTGRAPRAGSSLTTFDAAPYHTIDDGLEIGMTLQNPGNSGLKPERGKELEVGADIALFSERIGLDVTLFNQTTEDAILPNRLPPSAGFSQDPLQNLGEIRNRGLEARVRGDIIRTPSFGWDAQVSFSALDNELVSLGGAQPSLGSQRFQEGFPLAASFRHTLRGFDLEREVAIMSDTLEFMGTPYPRYEGSFSTNVSLGSSFQIYAQLDGKWDYLIFNSMGQYRDVSTPRSLGVQAPETLPVEERLQRFGPFETESGEPLAANLGRAQFHNERADHIRFRELALNYVIPPGVARLVRASRASVNVAVRNLALWTDYRGLDVDVARFSTTGLEMWDSAEFFVLPPGRRLAFRLNLGF